MKRTWLVLVSMATLVLAYSTPSQADNIFMFIPGIQGESNAVNRVGWMDILSVSWRQGDPPPGSTLKTQRFAPVMITKQTDSTSVPLALHSASAKMFPEVKLEITTNRDNASIVIYRLKLTNARVVSYATATSVSGSGGGSMFDEVGFFYDTITWIAFRINQQGQVVGTSSACWDLPRNAPCPVKF